MGEVCSVGGGAIAVVVGVTVASVVLGVVKGQPVFAIKGLIITVNVLCCIQLTNSYCNEWS